VGSGRRCIRLSERFEHRVQHLRCDALSGVRHDQFCNTLCLPQLDPDRAASLVNDALRDGSPEERRRIGSALADSGLLYEAIDDLMAENHGHCYSAFSLLFLVAKAGVVEPLSSVIEKHPSLDLSLAVIRLLASSGEPEVAVTLQRLASNTTLAPELRSAATESLSRF